MPPTSEDHERIAEHRRPAGIRSVEPLSVTASHTTQNMAHEIIVGVTGGIAAYKTASLVSDWCKAATA